MDSAKSINGVFNILTDKIITLDELTKISPCNRHETIKIMSRLVSHGAVERLENGVYRLTDYGKSLKKAANLISSGQAPADNITETNIQTIHYAPEYGA